MGEICKKYFYRKHWELPDKRIKNGGSSKDGILLKGALNSGAGHSWEQSVIVKSRKTVLGTVVEHKEHLTCETDNATLRAVSFLTVVQAAMSCLTHRLESSRLLCPWDFPGKSTGVGCHCLSLSVFKKSWFYFLLLCKVKTQVQSKTYH